MLGHIVLNKHLVGPVTEAILCSSKVSKAEVRFWPLVNVHTGPFLNWRSALPRRISFSELIRTKNDCIEVLDHLILSKFRLMALTVASSLVMRMIDDEVLHRAFLFHDWLAIVVNSLFRVYDHGGHLDGRLTRHVKFSAYWHESCPSKLRISHLSLEITAQSCLLLAFCTLAMHPKSDFVHVKSAKWVILAGNHLITVSLVKCDTIVLRS